MIEVFFDISSPWTYLAFHNLQLVESELKARLTWRPILVGGVFNTVNPSVYANRERPVPAKAAYMLKDLRDWAMVAGLKINMPPNVFPVNSVKAMRACILLAPQGKLVDFAQAAFSAYWSHQEDISNDAVLTKVCERAGVDSAAVLTGIERSEVKAALRVNTEDLIARGGFGSPTLFVDRDDMYFGNDRLGLALAAARKTLV